MAEFNYANESSFHRRLMPNLKPTNSIKSNSIFFFPYIRLFWLNVYIYIGNLITHGIGREKWGGLFKRNVHKNGNTKYFMQMPE